MQNGARVDVVNLMTFDYYDNAAHDMARDTETAAQGLRDQLARLYPDKSDAQLWSMIGVTEMPGVDDFGPAETFTLANARQVYDWAKAKKINTLSFWALQRDNGSCPGGPARDNCSGIEQQTGTSPGSSRPSPAAPAPRRTTSRSPPHPPPDR